MARLAAAMQIQQMRPMRMGLAPDFTSFTRSVFRPMAAMARIIRNLLRDLNSVKLLSGTPRAVQRVVITLAAKDSNTHIDKLQVIAGILSDEDNMGKVCAEKDAAVVAKLFNTWQE